jgi:hypothetical protein
MVDFNVFRPTRVRCRRSVSELWFGTGDRGAGQAARTFIPKNENFDRTVGIVIWSLFRVILLFHGLCVANSGV